MGGTGVGAFEGSTMNVKSSDDNITPQCTANLPEKGKLMHTEANLP